MTDVTRVSTKGQIVIPQDMRDALDINPGAALAIAQIDDYIVIKKIGVPDLMAEFQRLSKRGQELAKRAGLSNEQDVVKLVRRVRMREFKRLKRGQSK
jgi:AbrB family looped-hinge helix DNA binding protein